MRTLKLLRRYRTQSSPKQYQPGDLIDVANNLAHALIENKVAVLVTENPRTGKIEEVGDTRKLSSHRRESERSFEDRKRLKKRFNEKREDKQVRPGKQKQNVITK